MRETAPETAEAHTKTRRDEAAARHDDDAARRKGGRRKEEDDEGWQEVNGCTVKLRKAGD